MNQLQQIHNIVTSGFKVAKVETTRYDDIIKLFAQYSAKTSKALFLWHQRSGINRLSGKQIAMKNTRLLTEAINFIEAAPDFGIYLLKDFPEKYPVRISYQLQEIMSQQTISNCLIVLMGQHLPLDSVIGKFALTIQCGAPLNKTAGEQRRQVNGQQVRKSSVSDQAVHFGPR
ncbi:hypothetical protein MNBD_GAMMA12-901 [hydrothermal vent metagenome]|uniref:Uncharacterized protein n=1 Tax=hydrothermal vent metagenome TaxID=652676 RepID=A0A3B0YLV5_9ZZZZ